MIEETQILSKPKNRIKKLIASTTAMIFFYVIISAPLVEANFWQERRSSLKDGIGRGGKKQFAQVPRQLINHLPVVQHQSIGLTSLSKQIKQSIPKEQSSLLTPLLSSLPQSYGTIRKISFPPKITNHPSPVVIHIQDVHQNQEAQNNIAQAIAHLLSQTKVSQVALEGAFESDCVSDEKCREGMAIGLSRYRAFHDQESVRSVSRYLLQQNKISGPIHAALTHRQAIPSFLGIDDRGHYQANVEAYRQSSSKMANYKKKLLGLQEQTTQKKITVFNPQLLKFDNQVQAYRNGQSSLGAYVKVLASHTPKNLPEIMTFLKTLDLESSLDFNLVEKERTQLIEQLVKKLKKDQVNDLLNQSLAYRLGQIRYADFYDSLNKLCEKHGLSLARFPTMDTYIRYVLLADKINAETLFEEVHVTEAAAYTSLAKTEEESRLLSRSKQIHLTSKLVNFSLSPNEWKEYSSLSPSPALAGEGRAVPTRHFWLAPLGEGEKWDIASFEDFYIEAEARDQVMASNLISILSQKGESLAPLGERVRVRGTSFQPQTIRHHAPPESSVTILVTGGFHAPGITKKLTQAGATVISFVPKITKIDTKKGSAYLSVFTQEKTPLDKLFSGQKLFLPQSPHRSLFKEGPFLLSAKIGATAKYTNQIFRELVPSLAKQLTVEKVTGVLGQIVFYVRGKKNQFFQFIVTKNSEGILSSHEEKPLAPPLYLRLVKILQPVAAASLIFIKKPFQYFVHIHKRFFLLSFYSFRLARSQSMRQFVITFLLLPLAGVGFVSNAADKDSKSETPSNITFEISNGFYQDSHSFFSNDKDLFGKKPIVRFEIDFLNRPNFKSKNGGYYLALDLLETPISGSATRVAGGVVYNYSITNNLKFRWNLGISWATKEVIFYEKEEGEFFGNTWTYTTEWNQPQLNADLALGLKYYLPRSEGRYLSFRWGHISNGHDLLHGTDILDTTSMDIVSRTNPGLEALSIGFGWQWGSQKDRGENILPLRSKKMSKSKANSIVHALLRAFVPGISAERASQIGLWGLVLEIPILAIGALAAAFPELAFVSLLPGHEWITPLTYALFLFGFHMLHVLLYAFARQRRSDPAQNFWQAFKEEFKSSGWRAAVFVPYALLPFITGPLFAFTLWLPIIIHGAFDITRLATRNPFKDNKALEQALKDVKSFYGVRALKTLLLLGPVLLAVVSPLRAETSFAFLDEKPRVIEEIERTEPQSKGFQGDLHFQIASDRSMGTGARNLSSFYKYLNIKTEVSDLSFGGRVTNIFLRTVVAQFLAVVQHEYFGHGVRLRENGVSSHSTLFFSGFGFPFGINFNGFTRPERSLPFGSDGRISTYVGGVEANQVLAEVVRRDMLAGGAPYWYLPLYASKLDITMYNKLHPEFGDLFYYENSMIEKYNGKPGFSHEDIVFGEKWNLLDPTLWLSLYSSFKYVFQGEENFELPSFLPYTGFNLTPIGPEYYLGAHFSLDEKKEMPVQVYVRKGKGGDGKFSGMGVRFDEIPVGQKWRLGTQLDLWDQPFLGSGYRVSLEAKRIITDRLALSFGLNSKKAGYLLGEPNDKSQGWTLGLTWSQGEGGLMKEITKEGAIQWFTHPDRLLLWKVLYGLMPNVMIAWRVAFIELPQTYERNFVEDHKNKSVAQKVGRYLEWGGLHLASFSMAFWIVQWSLGFFGVEPTFLLTYLAVLPFIVLSNFLVHGLINTAHAAWNKSVMSRSFTEKLVLQLRSETFSPEEAADRVLKDLRSQNIFLGVGDLPDMTRLLVESHVEESSPSLDNSIAKAVKEGRNTHVYFVDSLKSFGKKKERVQFLQALKKGDSKPVVVTNSLLVSLYFKFQRVSVIRKEDSFESYQKTGLWDVNLNSLMSVPAFAEMIGDGKNIQFFQTSSIAEFRVKQEGLSSELYTAFQKAIDTAQVINRLLRTKPARAIPWENIKKTLLAIAQAA